MVSRKILKNNKGFTLVELIVVIVIIGILTAVLVPGLMRHISKARRVQVTTNCRTAVLAAQGVYAEEYGANTDLGTGDLPPAPIMARINAAAPDEGVIKKISSATSYIIDHLVYEEGADKVTYCSDYAACADTDHSVTFNFDEDSVGSVAPAKPQNTVDMYNVYDPNTGEYIKLPTVGDYLSAQGSYGSGTIFYYSGDAKDANNKPIPHGYYIVRYDDGGTRNIDKFTDKDFATYVNEWHYLNKLDEDVEPKSYSKGDPYNSIQKGGLYYVDLPWANADGPVLAYCNGEGGAKQGAYLDESWRDKNGMNIFIEKYWTVVKDENGEMVKKK